MTEDRKEKRWKNKQKQSAFINSVTGSEGNMFFSGSFYFVNIKLFAQPLLLLLVKSDDPRTTLSDIVHSWLIQRPWFYNMSETSLLSFRVQGCHETFLCCMEGQCCKVANPLPQSERTLEFDDGRRRGNKAGVNTEWLLKSICSLENTPSPVLLWLQHPHLFKCRTHQLFGANEVRERKS